MINLYRVLKTLTSKVRIISEDFMKRNKILLVDVQYVLPIIQNNLLSIFLRVRSSKVVLYANINIVPAVRKIISSSSTQRESLGKRMLNGSQNYEN